MNYSSKHYHLKDKILYTPLDGIELLNFPILNKDTAFTNEERKTFNLEGLLPPHIEKIEQQVARCYAAFLDEESPLHQHLYLRQLQDRNETLFYRLIITHLEEMMPIIYTPTVGDACQLFSNIYRRTRGLFIAYPYINEISSVLDNSPLEDVKVIVVTDGERILGLGDQGAGGMGIPIGKLSLYSACGGIHPRHTLPILLDVGTNNEKLRNDPKYIGWRHERIGAEEYNDFLEKFIDAVIKKFPHVLLQFEDFAQSHAFPLLEKYRDRLCTFNDDIQGTAAVAAGAILSAVKAAEGKLSDHKVAVFGAGSAGCGISDQIVQLMMLEGLSETDARSRFYMIDANGLLLDDDPKLKSFQKPLAQPKDKVVNWKLEKSDYIGLKDVMANAFPSILLGVSGQPNQFTEETIKLMAQNVQQPIIFPMSNPTSRCEAKPDDLIRWTKGNALIATGSPFPPVKYEGKTYPIAQCNNCYIFPGMGLGILASGAKRVTDGMFIHASIALSDHSPALKEKEGALLPPLKNIRDVSKSIAFSVAKQAGKEGVAKKISDDKLRENMEKMIWYPEYHKMERKK